MLGFHPISEASISEVITGVTIVIDDTGTLSTSGLAPTLAQGISVPQGILTLTGKAPSLAFVYSVGKGTLTLTGQAVIPDRGIPVSQTALTLTGQTLSGLAWTYAIPTGILTLTGQQPIPDRGILVGSTSLAIATLAPTLIITFAIPQGTLTLAGQQPIPDRGIPVGVAPALILTGQAPTLDRGFGIGIGALTLTGQTVTLATSFAISAGNLILTGQAPALATTFAIPAGGLALTGQSPNLAVGIPVGVATALIITGQTPTLGIGVPVGSASLAIATLAPTLDRGYIIGTYVFDFVKEDVSFALSIGPGDTATLTLTGQEPTPGFGIFIQPDTAVLSLTTTSNILDFVYQVPAQVLTIEEQSVDINVGPLIDMPVGPTLILTTHAAIVVRGIIPGTGSLKVSDRIVDTGLAQAGTSDTLTLGSGAPSTLPSSTALRLTFGAGSVQERPVSAFDGLVVTVSPRWRTNLLKWSDAFDNAVWGKAASGTGSVPVVTANFGLDPEGNQTADRVQLALNGGTTSADSSHLAQSFSPTVATHTASIWLKTVDASEKIVALDANGLGESPGTVTVNGNWQRFDFTYANDSGARPITMPRLRGAAPVTSDSADLLVWRAQVEQAFDVGDDIKTEDSAITLPDSTTGYEVIDTSLSLGFGYSVPRGTLTLSGQVPTRGRGIIIGETQLSITTQSLRFNTDYAIPTGSLTLTGHENFEGEGKIVPTGSITTAGYAPTLDIGVSVPTGFNNTAYNGIAPTFRVAFSIGSGSLTLTGHEIPQIDKVIPVSKGSLVLTALISPVLVRGIPVTGTALTITIQPAPTVEFGFGTDVGALTLEGQQTTFDRGIGVGAGSLTLIGLAGRAEDTATGTGILEIITYAPSFGIGIEVPQ